MLTDTEVIVINNKCTDHTDAVVREFSNVRLIHEKNQGLSYARNRGCDEAAGLYIGYIDDDAKVPASFVQDVITDLLRYDPDIYGGPVYPFYKDPKPAWFKDAYEIRKFVEESGFSETCRVSGGNFFIKKNLLMQLGGFDVTLGMKGNKIGVGEERALLERYRKVTPKSEQRVYYSLRAFIWHYVPPEKMSRWYMMRRFFQIGRTSMRIKGKEPASAFQRTFKFIPNQLTYARKEIRSNGIFNADYMKVVLNSCLRLGNVLELYSGGLAAVIQPHVKRNYKTFRRFLKRTPLRSFLFWYEKKLGIKV
jgi:glycosyltransferase involved in cell wall biosynthesis